jgi:hypothetical protein
MSKIFLKESDIFMLHHEYQEDMWRDLTGMGHKKALSSKAKGFFIKKTAHY